jgi:uncharacterized YigZ family protein
LVVKDPQAREGMKNNKIRSRERLRFIDASINFVHALIILILRDAAYCPRCSFFLANRTGVYADKIEAMGSYTVPLNEIRREQTTLNSRFIATLAPVFSNDEARAFLARIKKEFADASHNVPAYIIGGGNTVTEYFSDDGEPSGTAGKPVLAVLRGGGFGDVAVVVTRYFGGTLLGTGGLVKAYTESTQLVVNAVRRGRRVPVYVAMVAIPYHLLERVRLLVTRQGGGVLDEDYAADITMTVQFPIDAFEAFQNELRELSAGKLKAEVIESRETIVPLGLVSPK